MKKIIMHKSVHLVVIFLFSFSLLADATNNNIKSDHHQQPQNDKQQLRAQSRNADSTSNRRSAGSTSSSSSSSSSSEANKAIADMHSVYQQHLIGPNVASAVAPHETTKNDRKDIWSRFGSKEASSVEGGNNNSSKKGRLQTVGSVIGDIIGVLVSEIARFFGSVVSDVAREVTAHGFVSLFKQIADFTGISWPGSHHHTNNMATGTSH